MMKFASNLKTLTNPNGSFSTKTPQHQSKNYQKKNPKNNEI